MSGDGKHGPPQVRSCPPFCSRYLPPARSSVHRLPAELSSKL